MRIHQVAFQSSRHISRRINLQSTCRLFRKSLSTTGRSSNSQQTRPDITLYQYATCPFCNRVKSNLDFLSIEYKVVEVNPMSKKEIKSLNEKQVPVAVIDGDVIADSSAIVQHLYDNCASSKSPHIDRTVFMSKESNEWSQWSAERLAVLLYPNITRTLSDSWAAFAYVNNVKEWSLMERLTNRMLGPVAMYLVRNKIKQKYGIVDEKAELLAVLKEWTDAIASSSTAGISKFLGGSNLTQADLMVFGVLRGLEGLPAHQYVMSQNEALQCWYASVESEIARSNV